MLLNLKERLRFKSGRVCLERMEFLCPQCPTNRTGFSLLQGWLNRACNQYTNITSLGESQTCVDARRYQFTVEHVHIPWLSHEPLSLPFSTSHARHHLLSWRTKSQPKSCTARVHIHLYTAGSVQCSVWCCSYYIVIVNHTRHQHLAWMSYRAFLLISISM